MNPEVSQYIQNVTGFSKTTVEMVLESFFKFVQIRLTNRSDVNIPKFGTFSVRFLKARKGRNPKTEEEIDIPDSYKPKLKFSKNFDIEPDPALKAELEPVEDLPVAIAPDSKLPPPIPTELLQQETNRSWYIQIAGQPIEVAEDQLLEKGILPTSPVWNQEITGSWKLAKDVPELAYLFQKAA
ncbi:HU family DNA-binding protein [Cylindrospermum sp. FACHB-282]|uniref:HU family DNA-binding protein n=1 Tax=Cylindrospermum sp. FACHB-282 TaxID=2692794 RepID=UPI001681CC06|nr:HU family DNA-binding protein [Cylindrospermum sp. FACHB-282]MBD2386030.1 HU family DNA-binding protein [Cylindrospermum sp. FACHB-282]